MSKILRPFTPEQTAVLNKIRTTAASAGYLIFDVSPKPAATTGEFIVIRKDSPRSLFLVRPTRYGNIILKSYVADGMFFHLFQELKAHATPSCAIRWGKQLPQREPTWGWREYIHEDQWGELEYLT